MRPYGSEVDIVYRVEGTSFIIRMMFINKEYTHDGWMGHKIMLKMKILKRYLKLSFIQLKIDFK